jgi:hypothetical protein
MRFSLAILFAFSGLVLARDETHNPGKPRSIKPDSQPLRADAGEKDYYSIDDLRISIPEAMSAKVADAQILVVTLKIENLSTTKKQDYLMTAAHRALHELRDDLKNSYRVVDLKLAGQTAGNEAIYPGKTLTDKLIFEGPVEKAASLELSIGVPIAGIANRRMSFFIPRSVWADEPKGKPKPLRDPKADEKRPAAKNAAKAEIVKPAPEDPAVVAERRASLLLKAGRDLLEEGSKEKAQEKFQMLLDRYPDTKAAKEARKLLR